jgi:hypothetical protein
MLERRKENADVIEPMVEDLVAKIAWLKLQPNSCTHTPPAAATR